MAQVLMPKATAVWLVDNTTLTFEQIADFCNLHKLEVKAIADGDVASGIVGSSPITSRQLTQEEITRCESDALAKLEPLNTKLPQPRTRSKGPRYTPMSKRSDKPDAISWLIANCPELSNAQICSLIGTTNPTIHSVRNKTHWNSPNIKPRNPVLLGLCTQKDLNESLKRVHPQRQAPTLSAEDFGLETKSEDETTDDAVMVGSKMPLTDSEGNSEI